MSESELEDPSVWVRRQWNSGFLARYPLDALQGVHWDTISGGVNASAPQPFLHGYVWCDGMLEGELAHSCAHGEGPHHIKVCIVKRDNARPVFEQLVAHAGPKPKQERFRPVRELVAGQPITWRRKGHSYRQDIPGVVVAIGAKRVRIQVRRYNGTLEEHLVQAHNLAQRDEGGE